LDRPPFKLAACHNSFAASCGLPPFARASKNAFSNARRAFDRPAGLPLAPAEHLVGRPTVLPGLKRPAASWSGFESHSNSFMSSCFDVIAYGSMRMYESVYMAIFKTCRSLIRFAPLVLMPPANVSPARRRHRLSRRLTAGSSETAGVCRIALRPQGDSKPRLQRSLRPNFKSRSECGVGISYKGDAEDLSPEG
jgi:hypothetical protein